MAESGIGTAIRAAPESIKQVLQLFYASQWYTIVAESGIGTASSAAPESMMFYKLPCGTVVSTGSGVWHRYGQ